MIPARFDYAAPDTLEAALALLAEHGGGAVVLTGGHSLIPLLKLRFARPEIVIDLRRIAQLRTIAVNGGVLEIGGAATHTEVQRSADVQRVCPVLAETAGQIGDVQVRNAGTIGGSIVHADPAADWPAALLAVGAEVVLRGAAGERTVAADDFFVGALESAIRPGEILTAIRVPAWPAHSGGAYRKVKQQASGFALAGAAVELTLAGGAVEEVRVGITGVADTPYRPAAVEQALRGSRGDEDGVRAACAAAADGVAPLSDLHADAAYRANLARVLTRRAVLSALARASGGTG